MPLNSRKHFIASTVMAFASAGLPIRAALATATPSTILRDDSRTLEVNGKPAKILGLRQPNGRSELQLDAVTRFYVRLENHSGESTLIHWHGPSPPYGHDGVPEMPQPLLEGGRAYDYDFLLETPRTHSTPPNPANGRSTTIISTTWSEGR